MSSDKNGQRWFNRVKFGMPFRNAGCRILHSEFVTAPLKPKSSKRERTWTENPEQRKRNMHIKAVSVIQDKNRVQSVERAIRILHAFTRDTPSWGVTRLSAHLRLPKTIVLRLLETLEDGGFIEQDSRDLSYYLGRSIYELAGIYANQNEIIRVSAKYLQQLGAQTNFSTQIGILDGKETVCLACAESPMLVRAVFHPGLRRPAHATATGKVLLSGLSNERVRALFADRAMPAMTSKTIINVRRLIRDLEMVRHQGYAINQGESIVGLTAIAAPICNYQGQVIAGVSLGWPSQFVPSDQIAVLIGQVTNTANQISMRLGASNGSHGQFSNGRKEQ
jgi:IclR family transcriptional regulator, KDG regulon repressor